MMLKNRKKTEGVYILIGNYIKVVK